jgi:acyl-CoA reductase-like NAD-dependent aldehyde dehydrogenase
MHLPILRRGRPYRSLDAVVLTDLRSRNPVVEVGQANPGLIARDLAFSRDAAAELATVRCSELVALCRRAADLLAREELPVGEAAQSPDDYCRQVAATTGFPVALARRNLERLAGALREMERVLAGLTRGVPLTTLDRGWDDGSGRTLSFRRETDALGAVLPSNSPGVHALWLPSIPLAVPLALKPGRHDPWTPHRVAQAFLAAGVPPAALGVYPGGHAAGAEILLRCRRSLLFGDQGTVAPWRGDPGVQIHGPGWSKVLFGDDLAASWAGYLDLLEESVATNGGRSCVNASGIWIPGHGRALAEALAERLARIAPRSLDDPDARLVALPSPEAAERASAFLDSQLADGLATDVTARHRSAGRVGLAEDGSVHLLPTVLYTRDPRHPVARLELPFPFVTVVEAAMPALLEGLDETLVLSLLSHDPELRASLITDRRVDRLNLGPIPTSSISWDQPHEGNLFEHLYRQRSLQVSA